MFCDFCGSKNEDDANFCGACGNNLQQKATLYDQKTMNAPMIQYQPVEFQVQQKFFALRVTYKVSDVNRNEFMVVKRKFFNPIFPKLYIERTNGELLGTIEGNFFRTQWKLLDAKRQVHGIIYFPFIMFLAKSFRIATAQGMFNSGSSIFTYRFDVYSPNGKLSFEVDKKVLAIRDTFKIKSDGLLSPFITCSAAICIDQKFHKKSIL